MARKTQGNKFAAPGDKYSGRVKIGGGPVPIERWQRPLLRAVRDRPLGPEGTDLRAERPEHQSAPPPGTRSGPNYAR